MKLSRLLKRLLKKVIPLLVVVGLISSLFYIFQYSGIFNIKEITVSGEENYVSNEDIERILEQEKNKNIFSLSKEDLSNNLKNNFPAINRIEVTKQLPATIKVGIFERTGTTVLMAPNEYEGVLLDRQGFALGVGTRDLVLPVVIYRGEMNFSIGSFIEKQNIVNLLSLLEKLKERNITAKEVNLLDKYYEIKIDNMIVLWSSEKDEDNQIELLEKISKKYQIEGRSLSSVDLRFKDPIIKLRDESEATISAEKEE